MERSYNRALKHLSKAQNALDKAIQVADLIPNKLFSDANTLSDVGQSPEMSDSQKEAALKLAEQVKMQQARHETFVRDMNLRIVFAEDRVLMAEFACCRLFVLKVLIDLIPKKFEDRTLNSSFVQLANSISGLVKSENQLEDELKLSLFDKMANLELRILTLYVRIAKGQTAPLTANEAATLSAQLAEVEPILNGLKAVREQNSAMWRSRGEKAAAEGLEITPVIMSSRGENDEMLSKFIERSLDALRITVAIQTKA